MKNTCQNAFTLGRHQRLQYQLPSGRYKAAEFRNKVTRWCRELRAIRQLLSGRSVDCGLLSCTRTEMGLWVNQLLPSLCHHLGYDLLPAADALRFDGVFHSSLQQHLPVMQLKTMQLVLKAESALLELDMHGRSSEAPLLRVMPKVEALVQEAGELAEAVLELADGHHHS